MARPVRGGKVSLLLLVSGLLPGIIGCGERHHAPRAAPAGPPFVALVGSAEPFTRDPQRTVRGTVSDRGLAAATLTFNGADRPIRVEAGAFAATVTLVEGPNTILVTATNAAGTRTGPELRIVLDTIPPALALAEPQDGATTDAASIRVAGTVDDANPGTVTVNGVAATVTGNVWAVATLPLALGPNAIAIVATDRAGNATTVTITIIRAISTAVAPVVTIDAPADGALTNVTQTTVRGTVSDPGVLQATLTQNGVDRPIPVAGGAFAETVTLVEGPNTLRVSAANAFGTGLSGLVRVTLDRVAPALRVTVPAANAIIFTATVRVAGTVDDPGASIAVGGSPATVHGNAWELAAFPVPLGPAVLTVVATDAAGNSTVRTVAVERRPNVIERIALSPTGARLTTAGATLPLRVNGVFSDGITFPDLTASPDTSYATSNRLVAAVAADGTVTALANGAATVTVRHLGFEATAVVVVEAGVTLQGLSVAPLAFTLRAAGATQPLGVAGTFSDGSVRDISPQTTGTDYSTSDRRVATVSPDGLVTAVASGTATIAVRSESRTVAANVTVAIPVDTGFVRGEAYDDTKGLPLEGAAATLLADGGGPLAAQRTATTDARGRYALPGLEGDALVRIEKVGFTAVERAGPIPGLGAATLLDARLTPLDASRSAIASAVGGRALNAAGTVSLDLLPGGIPADAEVVLTLVSPQGLAGALPLGWSPAAAVDVRPAGIAFGQPATLALPSPRGLGPGSAVPLAVYDEEAHAWRALEPAAVSADGLRVQATLRRSGQLAFLVPDAAFPVPTAVPGQILAGVDPIAPPAAGLAATGEVVPPAAPAGPDARAVGTIVVRSPAPLPSGTVIEGRVSERYDLLDGGVAVPPGFTEDIVLHAFPRPDGGGL